MDDSDPGVDTIYQWVIDWGDGGGAQTITGDPDSVTHDYSIAGDHNITATAHDEDGSYSTGTSVSLAEVLLDALIVQDNLGGAQEIASDVFSPDPDFAVWVDSSGYASINVSGEVTPNVLKARQRARYRVLDSGGSQVSAGNLAGAANVALASGDYSVQAGIDANGNGALDAGEVSRVMQVAAGPERIRVINGAANIDISLSGARQGTITLEKIDGNGNVMRASLSGKLRQRIVPAPPRNAGGELKVTMNTGGFMTTMTVSAPAGSPVVVGEVYVVRVTDFNDPKGVAPVDVIVHIVP